MLKVIIHNQHFNGKWSYSQTGGATFSLAPKLHGNYWKVGLKPQEYRQYYYHPDHLGSASWISDSGGVAYEHLQYLPFGENWVEQHSGTASFATPYQFTSKEKDAETGYNYFGARYYDPKLSVWLSVDPMSDKYPNISAFAYVANNPSRLTDPDGRFIVDDEFKENFKNLYSYLTTKFESDVMNSDILRKSLMKYGNFESEEELRSVLHTGTVADGGTGPTLKVTNSPGGMLGGGATDDFGDIEISSHLVTNFENIFSAPGQGVDRKQAALLTVFAVILHETVHSGNKLHPSSEFYSAVEKIPHNSALVEDYRETSEIGEVFEISAWGLKFGKNNCTTPEELVSTRMHDARRMVFLSSTNPMYHPNEVLPSLPTK